MNINKKQYLLMLRHILYPECLRVLTHSSLPIGLRIDFKSTEKFAGVPWSRQTNDSRVFNKKKLFLNSLNSVNIDLEEFVFEKFDFELPFYFRYVDHTILCVPLNKIQILIDSFNSFHPRLQFTYEREINDRISFLDLELIRLVDGDIITNWYKKITYSWRILNFLSFHPFSNKIAVVKNLVDRAIGLSHDSFHYETLNIIRKILF